ncbi:MAG: MinD/ParA family protein [bacterium]|nr:MinD/ParA family protein [bacterium]
MGDQAEKLREAFQEYNGSGRKGTYIITVASGKGGVGKSTLTVNMGLLLSRKGKKVTVVDADFGLANVNVMLGVLPKYTLYHVFKGEKNLSDVILNIDLNFNIIAGASGFTHLVNLSEKDRIKFVDQLEQLNHNDFLLIDAGAGISKNVLTMMQAAHESFIVTTPEPTAIADAYGIIKAIISYDRDIRLNLIVNKARDFSEARNVSQRIINIAEQFLNVHINYLGFIFEDAAVGKSIRLQEPLVYHDPKSKAGLCLENIVNRILNIEPDRKQGGLRNFFQKFLSMN